jgi:hypothetical protein
MKRIKLVLLCLLVEIKVIFFLKINLYNLFT